MEIVKFKWSKCSSWNKNPCKSFTLVTKLSIIETVYVTARLLNVSILNVSLLNQIIFILQIKRMKEHNRIVLLYWWMKNAWEKGKLTSYIGDFSLNTFSFCHQNAEKLEKRKLKAKKADLFQLFWQVYFG